MSKRLSFHSECGELVIKFDGKRIPKEKLEGLFAILSNDLDRTAESLQKLYDFKNPIAENKQLKITS